MTIFYQTGKYDKMVSPVEVEKFTDISVWIDGLRRPRSSGWRNYSETEGEACEHRRDRVTNETCSWSHDLDDIYDSECGHTFYLVDAESRRPDLKWCLYCGLPLDIELQTNA